MKEIVVLCREFAKRKVRVLTVVYIIPSGSSEDAMSRFAVFEEWSIGRMAMLIVVGAYKMGMVMAYPSHGDCERIRSRAVCNAIESTDINAESALNNARRWVSFVVVVVANAVVRCSMLA